MRVACLWFTESAPTIKIAELFLRFSPQICLRKDRAIFIEIGKCRQLYSEASFMARAGILLKKYGSSARIAIASDLTDSLAFAKYNVGDIEHLPLRALIDFADPFERDEDLRKQIFNLVDSFEDLGIKTLGQFRKIPAGELVSRFGSLGRFCHQRAHLADFISWPLWTPEEVISETKEFPYFQFYGELEPILFELKTQLDQIFARLRAREKKVTRLQVQIRCEKTSTHQNFLRTLDFDFFAPQGSSKGALRILKERLGREFEMHPVRSPIEELRTKVLKTVHHGESQKNIFNNDEEKFEQIHSLHNQLIELLGKENVYQAELVEDRRPERSWIKRFDAPHVASESSPSFTELIPERATYLCRFPMRVTVMAGFVRIGKRCYRILHWDDQAEKISGGWFEKPVAEIKDHFDRNYYQVEIEGHQRISVFETPSREYYLHGYYG